MSLGALAAIWNIAWATIAAIYALWLFYLATMNLRRAREAGRLSRLVLAIALPILALAVAIDVAVNLVLATIVFFDRQREWTLSARLARYLVDPSRWRAELAMWIAEHLLDPFDPNGQHLRNRRT
jgi:hypothetical protein